MIGSVSFKGIDKCGNFEDKKGQTAPIKNDLPADAFQGSGSKTEQNVDTGARTQNKTNGFVKLLTNIMYRLQHRTPEDIQSKEYSQPEPDPYQAPELFDPDEPQPTAPCDELFYSDEPMPAEPDPDWVPESFRSEEPAPENNKAGQDYIAALNENSTTDLLLKRIEPKTTDLLLKRIDIPVEEDSKTEQNATPADTVAEEPESWDDFVERYVDEVASDAKEYLDLVYTRKHPEAEPAQMSEPDPD